jgi:cobaltochelatase CobS
MSSDMIVCKLCGERTHAMQIHLRDHHPKTSVAAYQAQFPEAPLLSETAKRKLAEKRAAAAATTVSDPALAATAKPAAPIDPSKRSFHEVFSLGSDPAARNSHGNPIPLTVLESDPELAPYIPDTDPNHVWDVENLKNVMMAIELDMPTYIWGHMGTGKTSDIVNICGLTNRPAIRVQHTLQTEESHILGQWVLRKGETVFNPGPLPLAMKMGLVYIADEYDFGSPGIMAVYQPVLEPKGALFIKDADPENRLIRPHPNFRFVATGNTNGSGDEAGLYQGTQIQNAANYDRFGMVIQKHYMKPEKEVEIVRGQAGIGAADAKKLVEFAGKVREAFEGKKISNTISPRSLISAARIGTKRGSMRIGLALAFGNKLNTVDRTVVDAVAQRIFGA